MTNDTSNFALWRDVLSSENSVPITQQDYKSVSHSSGVLLEISKLEEKFYIICEDYREIRRFLFDLNLEYMLYSVEDKFNYTHKKTIFSRFFLHFASSTQLYLDSLKRHIRIILTNDYDKKKIDNLKDNLLHNSFECRVMDYIRNHAKHFDLSAKHGKYGAAWDKDRQNLCYESDFIFAIADNGGDNRDRLEIQKEIVARGGEVSLVAVVTSYFHSMCAMHIEIRKIYLQKKLDSNLIIENIRNIWIENCKDDLSLTGVCAGKIHNKITDSKVEKIFIDLDIEIYADNFFKMTAELRNMDKKRVK